MDEDSTWEKNFEASIGTALETPNSPGNRQVAESNMQKLFWGRFKSLSDVKETGDQEFFLELAKTTLACLSYETGRPPKEIARHCFELGVGKNRDYGRDNIATFGFMGIIVRIGDKLNRIKTLKTRKAEVEEKLIDNLEDIFNYSVYGFMLSKGVWF